MRGYERGAIQALNADVSGPPAGVYAFVPSYYDSAYEQQAHATVIYVYQRDDLSSEELLRSQTAMREIAEEEFRRTPGTSERVYGTGIVDDEIARATIDSLRLVGAVGLVLALVVLWYVYSDPYDMAVALTGVALVLIWSIGFMGWVGIDFNPLFVSIPLFLAGLSIDFAIHAVTRYREERDMHEEPGGAHRDRRRGERPASGRVRAPMRNGIASVGRAFVLVTLTTVTAFAPMLFVPGVMGKFFVNIPMIVIPIFLVSLIEVLLILPAHLAHRNVLVDGAAAVLNFIFTLPERLAGSGPAGEEEYTNPLVAGQQKFSRTVERFVENVYRPFAETVLRYRYLTLSACLAMLMLTVGIIGSGMLKFEFMPKIEGDRVTASVQMPVGTPVERTEAVMERLVREGRSVLEEAEGNEPIGDGVMAELGVSGTFNSGPGPSQSTSGSHLTQVAVSLVQPGEREMTSKEFAERWRERVGEIAGADSVDYQFDIGPGAGEPVAIELRHDNTETLRRAAGELADKIAQYDGVYDVSDGFQLGKEQLGLRLKPAGRAAGLTETDLARQVRAAFFGNEVAREQRGRDELRVYVRKPEAERNSEYFLRNMIVRTPQGEEMELQQAAEIRRSRAPSSIEREGGGRVVEVTADVDSSVTTGGEITASLQEEVLPEMMDHIPGLTYELTGEQQARQEGMTALFTGFAIALLVMFALMAIAFRSYVQPAIIMGAIPFGIVGAVAGHLLMGFNLSLISMFGLVALSGVVVNDSLVLVAAINDYRRNQGMHPVEAVTEGGVRRFRPILLTSLTTFFGLAPMIFETSIQAQFLIPMALSLGFGVLFVTVIALVIVPALYLALYDIKAKIGAVEDGDD